MLRKVAIAVGILFANWLKPLITARVANISGRGLEIGGGLNVRKSLTPTVETSDIRFENAKWAKDPEFVAIERLRFRIKLLELLRGNPAILTIRPQLLPDQFTTFRPVRLAFGLKTKSYKSGIRHATPAYPPAV